MGIGSKLKKLARKVIPKEASALAPIVSVFNPAIGAALGAAGGLREGNIGKAVMGGLTNYGLGSFAQGMGAPSIGKSLSSGLGSFMQNIPGVSALSGSPIGQGLGSIFKGLNTAGGNAGAMLKNLASGGGFQFPEGAMDVNPATGTYRMQRDGATLQAAKEGGAGNIISDMLGGKKATGTGEGGSNALGFGGNDLLMRALIGGGSYLAEKKDLDEAKKMAAASGQNKSLAELEQQYALAPVYAEGGRADDRNGNVPRPMGFTEETPTRQMTAQEGIMGPASQMEPSLSDFEPIPTYANGGRTGYSDGSDIEDILIEQNLSEGMSLNVAKLLARDEVEKMRERDSSYAAGGRVNAFLGGLFGGNKDAMTDQSGISNDPEYAGWKNMFSQNPELAAMHPRHMEFKQYHDSQGKANGGRIGYENGGLSDKGQALYNQLIQSGSTEEQAMENIMSMFHSGMYDLGNINQMELGERQNKNKGGLADLGGHEMDMRPGGFIPIGAKEKADDIPARLSKNEFVFTADAVREFGDGNVNKGAKKMYDMMNQLEQGARV